MQIDTNGFEIEDRVRDRITGFEGVVTGISQFVTGCARATIQPPMSAKIREEGGKMPDAWFIDVLTLEMVEEGPRHKILPDAAAAVGEFAAATASAVKGGPPTIAPRR